MQELLYGIEKISPEEVERLGLGKVGKVGLKAETYQNPYDKITNEIIALIESSEDLPWRIPWTTNTAGDPNFPFNYASKRYYSGVNLFVLAMFMIFRKKRCPYFMTFKQIEELKGSIKKGSKGFPVMFYTNDLYRSLEDNKTIGKAKYDALPEGQKVMYEPSWTIKSYNVFNLEDVENITFDNIWEETPLPEERKIANCERVIESMPNRPKIQILGSEAFYSPAADMVVMPNLKFFEKEQQYYSTFYHELIHSTGSANRLERKMGTTFGNEDYAFEELIAELGASYLCGETGILYFTIKNSAAYLKSWKKRVSDLLKENNKAIFKGAAQAQRAVDYILGKADPAIYSKFKKIELVEKTIKKPKPETPGRKNEDEPRKDLSIIAIKIRQRQALSKLT
jgi:antirestriction protein ArdC